MVQENREKRSTRDKHVAGGCPKKPKDVETNFQQLLTSSSASNSVSLIDSTLLTSPNPELLSFNLSE
jgi:hypothetical protein